MDPFVVIIVVLLIVIATPIAMAWFYMARKAAPYRDESGNSSSRGDKKNDTEIIVIDEGRSSGKGQ